MGTKSVRKFEEKNDKESQQKNPQNKRYYSKM